MPTPRDEPPRCAVVYNPIKISHEFRGLVEAALHRDGWADPLWLATTKDDPGKAMTTQAVRARADLVMGAGGDGTIRMIANGLAGSGIPLGLIPAGTGNLLARNLNLPLDETSALEIALARHTRSIDLIQLTVDDHQPQHFAVMAGVGVGAVIMDETDPDLKAKIGTAAYLVAAGRALRRLPMRVTVRVDNQRPLHRQAMLCLVGNVGDLQGRIRLIADAQPDDGLLDVYIASPRKFIHWVKIALRMITRKARKDDQVDQLQGKAVTITVRGTDNYQLDGDALGECHTMTAEIQPDALSICVPSRCAADQSADFG